MTSRSFNRLALLTLTGSAAYMIWFLTTLEWHREGTFRVAADLPATTQAYVAFVLPPALLLAYLVLRRLLLGDTSSG
ncbi:MAG: hypothetical protein GY720_14335 [bacterium]|nr:hypothetical protein [bacterium]